MNAIGQSLEAPDLGLFDQNRTKYPHEQLKPFEGQHVAWSPDGARILASGVDMDAVEKKLVAAGINPNQVVFDYIDPGDVTQIRSAADALFMSCSSVAHRRWL